MKLIKTCFFIFSFFIFLASSCKKQCKDCRFQKIEKKDFLKDEYPLLKMDCALKEHQPVHLDLVNGFGVFAKPINEPSSGNIGFAFRLKEVEGCTRYKLLNAKYLCKDSIKNVHHIKLKIEKRKEGDTNDEIKLTAFPLKIGEQLDIHIESCDERIASARVIKDCPISTEKPLFGQGICRTIIIEDQGDIYD